MTWLTNISDTAAELPQYGVVVLPGESYELPTAPAADGPVMGEDSSSEPEAHVVYAFSAEVFKTSKVKPSKTTVTDGFPSVTYEEK